MQVSENIMILSVEKFVSVECILQTFTFFFEGPAYPERAVTSDRFGNAFYTDDMDATNQYVRSRDQPVLETISRGNPDELVSVVTQVQHSMCGMWPTYVLMQICRQLGWSTPQLLTYATSDDVMRRNSNICGFASFAAHL